MVRVRVRVVDLPERHLEGIMAVVHANVIPKSAAQVWATNP